MAHRDPTRWTFTLVQKDDDIPDRALIMSLLKSGGPLLDALQGTSNHTSALAQCVLLTAANLLQSPSYCFLWYSLLSSFYLTQPKLTLYHDRYHPPQIITPVLTAWNPHLILQAITCIHCIVSMYTKPSTSPRRLYAAGKPRAPPHASHWLMGSTGGLLVLWLIVAAVTGFASEGKELLQPSTWVTCLMLFTGAALFIYVQVLLRIFYSSACMTMARHRKLVTRICSGTSSFSCKWYSCDHVVLWLPLMVGWMARWGCPSRS